MHKEIKMQLTRYITKIEASRLKGLSDLAMQQHQCITYLEQHRARLYKILERRFEEELNQISILYDDYELDKECRNFVNSIYLDGWKIEFNGSRIKIYANDYPVRNYDEKTINDFDYLNKRIQRNISRIIKQSIDYPHFQLKKVFVFVKFYLPLSTYDVDNIWVRPIINGIKNSGLIYDDDNTSVTYGFEGLCDKENPHMEIFIYNKDNINYKEILN